MTDQISLLALGLKLKQLRLDRFALEQWLIFMLFAYPIATLYATYRARRSSHMRALIPTHVLEGVECRVGLDKDFVTCSDQ